jgi:hypothetical protein
MGVDARMFVRTPTKGLPDLQRVAWEMCASFGAGHFWIARESGRRALAVLERYEQDGPDIFPAPEETFVNVSLRSRYWGPGYERGDLPLILTLAEWLERKFQKGAVWYGGDSSGVCAAPLDSVARAALLDHAASGSHGFLYRLGFSLQRGPGAKGQSCEFCGNVPMAEMRWGQGLVGFICIGCDLHRLVGATSCTEAVGRWPDETKAVSS